MDDAKALAREWVEAHLITKSKQRDLFRTRAAIRKVQIREQLIDESEEFSAVFYTEVERILLEKAKK